MRRSGAWGRDRRRNPTTNAAICIVVSVLLAGVLIVTAVGELVSVLRPQGQAVGGDRVIAWAVGVVGLVLGTSLLMLVVVDRRSFFGPRLQAGRGDRLAAAGVHARLWVAGCGLAEAAIAATLLYNMWLAGYQLVAHQRSLYDLRAAGSVRLVLHVEWWQRISFEVPVALGIGLLIGGSCIVIWDAMSLSPEIVAGPLLRILMQAWSFLVLAVPLGAVFLLRLNGRQAADSPVPAPVPWWLVLSVPAVLLTLYVVGILSVMGGLTRSPLLRPTQPGVLDLVALLSKLGPVALTVLAAVAGFSAAVGLTDASVASLQFRTAVTGQIHGP